MGYTIKFYRYHQFRSVPSVWSRSRSQVGIVIGGRSERRMNNLFITPMSHLTIPIDRRSRPLPIMIESYLNPKLLSILWLSSRVHSFILLLLAGFQRPQPMLHSPPVNNSTKLSHSFQLIGNLKFNALILRERSLCVSQVN